MKKKFILVALALACLSTSTVNAMSAARAQRLMERAEKRCMKRLLVHRNYTFVATDAVSSDRNAGVELSGLYGLWTVAHQFKVYLPLYGSNTHPIEIADHTDFANDHYSYKVRPHDGGHMVVIKARRHPSGHDFQYRIHVNNDGTAVMTVETDYRNPVTFYGYITPLVY